MEQQMQLVQQENPSLKWINLKGTNVLIIILIWEGKLNYKGADICKE